MKINESILTLHDKVTTRLQNNQIEYRLINDDFLKDAMYHTDGFVPHILIPYNDSVLTVSFNYKFTENDRVRCYASLDGDQMTQHSSVIFYQLIKKFSIMDLLVLEPVEVINRYVIRVLHLDFPSIRMDKRKTRNGYKLTFLETDVNDGHASNIAHYLTMLGMDVISRVNRNNCLVIEYLNPPF